MIIDLDLYIKIQEATMIEYDGWKYRNEDGKIFVTSENIESMLYDLLNEFECIKEEFEDYKTSKEEEINDYYKPKNPYEIYGLNENEF